MAADVNDLVKAITADVKTIVRSEVELAKSELIPSAKNAGIGAGMFGGAGYVALNALSLLFMAGGFGIGALFEQLLHWPVLGAAALGYVIMAVIMLVIVAILALIGKGRFSKVKGPDKTIAEAQITTNEAKDAVSRGVEDVNSGRSFEQYVIEQSQRRADFSTRNAPVARRGFAPTGSADRDAAGTPVAGATSVEPVVVEEVVVTEQAPFSGTAAHGTAPAYEQNAPMGGATEGQRPHNA